MQEDQAIDLPLIWYFGISGKGKSKEQGPSNLASRDRETKNPEGVERTWKEADISAYRDLGYRKS
jgi:hypothetical protein